MNNNRNNNRRRGRGNRQIGGGQQLNRIDSRARGNAPQLLEKYRKLAQDAHLNGDRVQAEYYLQFADHYFRVLADQRLRQEEQRLRRDDRWEGGVEDGADDAGEFGEGDFPTFDQASYQRRDREDRPREERPREERPREDRPREERPREERPREERTRGEYQRPSRQPVGADSDEAAQEQPGITEADSAHNRFEPAENPFVREQGAGRGLKPRRNARTGADRGRPQRDAGAMAEELPGIDPAILPPSIAQPTIDADGDASAAPVKRPRGRPRKIPAAEAGDAMAAAGRD